MDTASCYHSDRCDVITPFGLENRMNNVREGSHMKQGSSSEVTGMKGVEGVLEMLCVFSSHFLPVGISRQTLMGVEGSDPMCGHQSSNSHGSL